MGINFLYSLLPPSKFRVRGVGGLGLGIIASGYSIGLGAYYHHGKYVIGFWDDGLGFRLLDSSCCDSGPLTQSRWVSSFGAWGFVQGLGLRVQGLPLTAETSSMPRD